MDDLTRIKGIGKATADKLGAAGIDSFLKLANLAPDHSAREEVDIKDDWIAQAGALVPAEEPVAMPPDATPATRDDRPVIEKQEATPAPAGFDPGGMVSQPSDRPTGIPVRPAVIAPDGAGADANDGWAEFPDDWAGFPHLKAALDAWAAEHGSDTAPQAIRVAAKRAGFRRAGIAHSTEPVSHPLETLYLAQIEALLAEPMIDAVLVE